MANVLEPGKIIRPIIDHECVKLLAERLYGISVLELTELNGYDDKNYKIIEDPNVRNPLAADYSEHGYVMKILNAIDSIKLDVIEAQNETMNFLYNCGVTCPKPVRNVFGQLYSIEKISGKQHAVKLLNYIPGELLKDVPKSEALFYQLGVFVADLDKKLENFSHSGLVSREHIWMMSKVPELDKLKYVIKDADKLNLAEEVIEEFKSVVVPRMGVLQKGVIHGDVNEMNVLCGVKPGGSEADYDVTGIIDFGDVQHSCYVFELTLAMTYMMLLTGDPRSGGSVLAGYTTVRPLPDPEYRLLKTLISARLVQSLIIGAYTIEQDPNNTYVTSTEKANGWELLKKIRSTKPSAEHDDPTDWRTIADEYLTAS